MVPTLSYPTYSTLPNPPLPFCPLSDLPYSVLLDASGDPLFCFSFASCLPLLAIVTASTTTFLMANLILDSSNYLKIFTRVCISGRRKHALNIFLSYRLTQKFYSVNIVSMYQMLIQCLSVFLPLKCNVWHPQLLQEGSFNLAYGFRRFSTWLAAPRLKAQRWGKAA